MLERSGLLIRDIDGRVHRCEMDPAPLDRAVSWVEMVRSHWTDRFDDADYVEKLQGRRRGGM